MNRKFWLWLIVFSQHSPISVSSVFCQDQYVADSLKVELKKGNTDSITQDILSIIVSEETNPELIVSYADTLLHLSKKLDSSDGIHIAFLQKGNGYRLLGNIDLAIENLFKALEIAKNMNSDFRIGITLFAIADTYSSVSDSKMAMIFYDDGISQLRNSKSDDGLRQLASALFNAGDELLMMSKLDSSQIYFAEASRLFDELNYVQGKAYCLGNIGLVYAEQGKFLEAEQKLDDAIDILEELGDTYGISSYQTFMADVYLQTDYHMGALIHANIAYENAIKHDLKEQIRDASLMLSEIYEKMSLTGKAINYLKAFIQYSDSLTNPQVISRVAQIRREYEESQQKTDLMEIPTEITDSRPEYYALVIGVSDYLFNSEGLTDLDEPIRDAIELQRTLTNSYTFEEDNVILLKNPNRSRVINALEAISASITPSDNLLVFYAGHGIWDEKLEIGYWLPADATMNSKANWLSNSRIRDYISGIKTKHTLLISDACFSGSIFKTRSVAASTLETTLQVDGFAKVYRLPSRKAMTSGALNTVPDQSSFMAYLIRRLEDNQKRYISARQVFTQMETAVINNTSNVPQYGTIQNAGDEGGDFIFIRK